MSLEYEFSPYCKNELCTARLQASADIKNEYCSLCWEDSEAEGLIGKLARKTLKELENEQ